MTAIVGGARADSGAGGVARHPWLALAQHDRPFRSVLDQMPVGLLLFEARSRAAVLINAAAWSILGDATAGEFMAGRFNSSRWLEVDGQPCLRECPIETALRGESVSNLDRCYVSNSDQRRWLRVSASPLRDSGGSVIGVVMCLDDIAREHEVRQQFTQSNRYLKTLLEASPLAVSVLDRDGILHEWNPAAERMFGWKREEVIGRTPPPVHANAVEEFRTHVRETIRGNGVMGKQTQRRHKDGQLIDVALWSAPLQVNGDEPDRLISVCADISELKRARQELQELTVDLEQRVAERTHQLRALATEITQVEQRERQRLAQLLHDHLQQLLVAANLQLAHSLRQIDGEKPRGQVQRVEEMIREAIGASRSLAVELYPPVLHNGGLRPALEWLAERKQQRYGLTVTLQYEAQQELDEHNQEMRTLVFHLVRELLFNVVKHAGVEEALVRVTNPRPDELEVLIADEGVGCDPTDLFEAEIQGFGLLHVRERLLAVGGALRVDSAPGQGCRMSVLVPIKKRPASPDSAAGRPRGGRSKRRRRRREAQPDAWRVLLVDDHRIVREGLAGLLREQGDLTIVGEAENGEKAVQLASELRPDIIIMDVNMPVMNGIDACRQICASDSEVRVVGLSMHGDDHCREAMREAGAAGFVSKGGPLEELVAAIHEAVGREA